MRKWCRYLITFIILAHLSFGELKRDIHAPPFSILSSQLSYQIGEAGWPLFPQQYSWNNGNLNSDLSIQYTELTELCKIFPVTYLKQGQQHSIHNYIYSVHETANTPQKVIASIVCIHCTHCSYAKCILMSLLLCLPFSDLVISLMVFYRTFLKKIQQFSYISFKKHLLPCLKILGSPALLVITITEEGNLYMEGLW